MNNLAICKDVCSILNMILIIYILLPKEKIRYISSLHFCKIVFMLVLIIINIVINRVSLHVAYTYIIIVVTIGFLGYLSGHAIKFNIIISCVYLSVISLAQVMACTLLYMKIDESALYLLSNVYQIKLIIVKEIIIVICTLCIEKVVRRIPEEVGTINFFTIIIPIMINVVILSLIGDNLYYDDIFIIDNIVAVATIFIAGFIMLAGNLCNIIVLEYYLNVKSIENERKLQISEMSLQYDYYVKLEEDMENIRKISHDIKNHLEALRGENDIKEKNDYIDSIESRLDKYESYYKTGNTFIDNLLHRKKLEASVWDIQFKVIADLSQFKEIRKEDLCVIISNAVDNALRECTLRKKEEPLSENLIEIRMGKFKGFLSISCENSIRKKQASVIEQSENLETTKDDKLNHGYGMKNIESTVKYYDGTVSVRISDDMFRLIILIPSMKM